MAFGVSGLISGIDTDSLVSQLVAASAQPRQVIARQKAVLEDKKDAFATLSSRLSSLKTSLEDIDTEAEFRSSTGTSGNEDVVGVTVAGDAAVGTFSVKVNQRAQSALYLSGGFDAAALTTDGVVGTGTLNLTYDGVTTAVTIDASTSSLQDVVDAINDNVEGVSAYIMDTGASTGRYRIALSGEDTGADYDITVDASGLTSDPGFTQNVAAQDAEIEVNGITITHADNDIEDVVEGVTFHALEEQDPADDAISVTVARDLDGMVEKINTFVSAYNNVISYIRTQTVYNEEENLKGAFIGESTHRSVQQRLQTVLSDEYGVSTVITALSQMGFSTAQDGDLEIDEDELRDALSDNFDAAVSMFTDAAGVNLTLQDAIDVMTDEDTGTVTARIDGLADSIEDQEERLERFDDRLESYEARLKRQFTAMELAMARFQSAGQSLLALMPSTSSGNDE
jgi:flagellar hook-associated protein 2